jgi:hypothetical protein
MSYQALNLDCQIRLLGSTLRPFLKKKTAPPVKMTQFSLPTILFVVPVFVIYLINKLLLGLKKQLLF